MPRQRGAHLFYMRSFWICILLGIGLISVKAQDNYARLTVLIGSHIEFNFNSLDKYNSGMQITDGTTLGVAIGEIAPAVMTGWHLDVQTWMGATDLTGSTGATLPSETIQIMATDANGNLGTAIFTGLQDLTAAGATLMSTNDLADVPADPNTHQINITYECGMTAANNLLGATADYYTIEVEFILIPDF